MRQELNTPTVILCAPLFGQAFQLTREDREKARKLVFENRHDAAVQALFNLIERKAFSMQAEGVQHDATAHDQGQACGALYLYQLTRTWLESAPTQRDDSE
jgi:hypothetical protein